MGEAAHFGGAERYNAIEGEESFVAALDPVRLPPPPMRREHHRTDDRVETRGIAAAGGDRDPHQPGRPSRAMISPSRACRRRAFLEKTRRPSTVTSKIPPEAGTSRTSASGNAAFSSAARPAARGW